VDLSSELVEKDPRIKQMGTQTCKLEEQVEVWDNTIEVLGNQLHNAQHELEEANEHLEMHHQEMHTNMEVDKDEEVDIEEEEDLEEPEPTSSLDTESLFLGFVNHWFVILVVEVLGSCTPHGGLAFGPHDVIG
jgi:chromosome segregation ATPase